jgi:hypothetical protein
LCDVGKRLVALFGHLGDRCVKRVRAVATSPTTVAFNAARRSLVSSSRRASNIEEKKLQGKVEIDVGWSGIR